MTPLNLHWNLREKNGPSTGRIKRWGVLLAFLAATAWLIHLHDQIDALEAAAASQGASQLAQETASQRAILNRRDREFAQRLVLLERNLAHHDSIRLERLSWESGTGTLTLAGRAQHPETLLALRQSLAESEPAAAGIAREPAPPPSIRNEGTQGIRFEWRWPSSLGRLP